MQFPFRIIESNIANRRQFDIVDGYQPTHAFFYLIKGSFDIDINGTRETVTQGESLIIPDYLHFKRNVINPIEFVYVKFIDNPNCPYSLSIPHGKVRVENQARFASNIAMIEQLIMCEDAFSVNYREHILQDILFQISSNQRTVNNSTEACASHNALVLSAIAYIKENITKKILIEDICRAIGSNSSTLNFNFRRELDMSLGQYIMSERMKKAKRYLRGTTYSISEIATRCGFENVYYFSNTFKKTYGVSPSEYKNNGVFATRRYPHSP